MQIVKFKGIEIGVREATVRDDLHAQIINNKLTATIPEGEMGLWRSFADLITATGDVKGLPFDPQSLHIADAAAIQAAYEWYLDQPKTFKERWGKAYAAANADDESPDAEKNG